jgi:predicted nucleic acid-binding protein
LRLVVDTNILVSFFRHNPVYDLISYSTFLDLQLFVPEYAIQELKNNEESILKYSKLNPPEFNKKLSELISFIRIIPKNIFMESEEEANELSPHEKDFPFFALALKLKCGIWSNELEFKNQNKVTIFNTEDMIELFF